MTLQRMTRTYEGRVPAKPLIEQGILWIPVVHHVADVFENKDTHTTVTFAQAEGQLADETLALADEYRVLRQQIEHPPHPAKHFEMHAVPTLPSWVGDPVERAGWQVYTPGDEFYASHSDVSQGHPRIFYYRLTARQAGVAPHDALAQFEAAVVAHGRTRIKLKQVNAQMRTNANTLKARMA